MSAWAKRQSAFLALLSIFLLVACLQVSATTVGEHAQGAADDLASPPVATTFQSLHDSLLGSDAEDETGAEKTDRARSQAEDAREDAADGLRARTHTTLAAAQTRIQETRDMVGSVDALDVLEHQVVDPLDQARSNLEGQVYGLTSDNGAPPDRMQTDPAPASVSATEPEMSVEGYILIGATAAGTMALFWFIGSTGSISGGAVGAGAAGAKLSGKDLLPLASPLFTRFEKDTVLGHPKRELLYGLIIQRPGITLQDLGDASNLSRTAVTHHLRLLEQQHLIVSRRQGRSRHYFENGGRYAHDQKEAYAVLQNDRSREVAMFIEQHPGTIQKQICEQLGIQPSVVHWHVERLAEASLVDKIRVGRTVQYFMSQPLPRFN